MLLHQFKTHETGELHLKLNVLGLEIHINSKLEQISNRRRRSSNNNNKHNVWRSCLGLTT